MEQVKAYNDIFGSPTLSYGPNKRQGSNESFLVQVQNGKWVSLLKEPLRY
jgi:branched-chain amino acid transport system substrate-binding protein